MKLFKQKKPKKNKTYRNFLDFYPKFRIFHYINRLMYGDKANKMLLAQRFGKDVGYFPNIENPQSLNEKILWLTQYYQNPLTTLCADKYRVKDYIKEQLGEGLTVPTIASYDNVYDIDLDKLPDQFVLKVNWGWGGRQVIVVKDKSQADINSIRAKIDDWVQPWNNFYYISYDWGYKHMKPQIYAEKYVEQADGQLTDYKIYCFNGKPVMVLVIADRFGAKKISKTFFDADWNLLPVKRPEAGVCPEVERPAAWEEMLKMAQKLAQPFPLLRVDFYLVDGKPYIGEMTFHPGSGFEPFEPREWDYKLGSMLQLPEKMLTDKE